MTSGPWVRWVPRYLSEATLILLAVGSAVCREPPWTEGSTTLVVLPDTEVYANKRPATFKAQFEWIDKNRVTRNIAGILHVGDVTNNNTEREWKVARECFDLVEGKVPYILATGNHDYDNTPGRETLMNDFFHVADLEKWPTFGGVYERGHLENHYQLIGIQGRKWLILSLECGPRNAVIDWANKVLARHRNHPAIILTHAYLYYGNERYDHERGRERASPHGLYGEGADGEELWSRLVRRHPGVMMVICGHLSSGYVGYREDEGDYGNAVHQMMCDYEKMSGGGMGFLRLLEFLPDGRTVQVRTFSPVTGEVNPRDPDLEQFTFKLRPATRDEPRPTDLPSASPLAKAPVHRFSFDGRGGDGARILDSKGKSHGRLNAAGTPSALDGRGRLELLDGGHVTLPPDLLQGLQDVSFEVWFTPTAKRYKWNSVVRFGSRDDWLVYVFRTLTVHRAEIAVDRYNEDIQRRIPVEPGTRMHVVVTYDRDGADGKPLLGWYRDGKLVDTMPTRLKLEDVDDSASSVGPFAGTFDELRMYDYPLSPDEVRGTFESGPEKLRLAETGAR